MRRTRAQRAMMSKPSCKAIRAAIASMAPLDMPQSELAKKQPRRKLTDDTLEGLWEDKDGELYG